MVETDKIPTCYPMTGIPALDAEIADIQAEYDRERASIERHYRHDPDKAAFETDLSRIDHLEWMREVYERHGLPAVRAGLAD